MPIVNIAIFVGRTSEQKTRMFKEVTEALHRTLGAPHANIRIILNEMKHEDFSVGGIQKRAPDSPGSGD